MKYHTNLLHDEGFKVGLDKAVEIAASIPSKKVYMKFLNLNQTEGVMQKIFGEEVAKYFKKHKEISLVKNVILYLETDKLKKNNLKEGVIFLPWAISKDLLDYVHYSGIEHSVYTPYTHEELSNYIDDYPDSKLIDKS